MPIDWANVSWIYVGVLAVFVFLSSLIGSLLGFRHRILGSVLSAALFAVIFVFWTYYPHHLPLPTRLAAPPAATGPAISPDRFKAVTPSQPNQ